MVSGAVSVAAVSGSPGSVEPERLLSASLSRTTSLQGEFPPMVWTATTSEQVSQSDHEYKYIYNLGQKRVEKAIMIAYK